MLTCPCAGLSAFLTRWDKAASTIHYLVPFSPVPLCVCTPPNLSLMCVSMCVPPPNLSLMRVSMYVPPPNPSLMRVSMCVPLPCPAPICMRISPHHSPRQSRPSTPAALPVVPFSGVPWPPPSPPSTPLTWSPRRCPFWHPYMLQRWTDLVQAGLTYVPVDKRKVVLYYSRTLADARCGWGKGRQASGAHTLHIQREEAGGAGFWRAFPSLWEGGMGGGLLGWIHHAYAAVLLDCRCLRGTTLLVTHGLLSPAGSCFALCWIPGWTHHACHAGVCRLHNGGRKVLNEEVLKAAMLRLLAERGQNEILRVLNLDDFKTYREVRGAETQGGRDGGVGRRSKEVLGW